ncbi:IclR family transcriptional regulator [Amycolatopsis sp. FDAARGOS 1241]|uniref:IclR family transcriptional regulator n=1 Tax=Amycolatopsis sp. FDAARGOS 1241 TaxID=2778070 RepID=UPI00194E0E33|nr:IclR family transcriptional regulator [Amycolatopsis sp. FDAARGOS 1241]QRP42698.1 helix-turn-helix domain-containing protein [Amycolatopsis sp. FDAARGOS 1241]
MKKPTLENAVASSGRSRYPIESVDRALRLLLLLGERSELRVTDAAEYLDVALSTAHRLLAMLQYRGFIQKDVRTKLYRPGTSLTAVAFAILHRFDVREILRPFLEKLNTELSETVHLVILDGGTVRFVDAVESTRPVRVASRLGLAMPASCSSAGKAMLATAQVAELHRMYSGIESGTLAVGQDRTWSDLELEIENVRRHGYAISGVEGTDGVASVAAALPTKIVSEPGTINNCTFPAGIGKASVASAWATTNVVTECLASLLDAHPEHRERLMSVCCGTWDFALLAGVDQRGGGFVTMLCDSMAGGLGARTHADGVDTGGMACIPMGASPTSR